MADFILTIPRRKAFIDVHSYSQLWMSPWGFTEEFPPDFEAQVCSFLSLEPVLVASRLEPATFKSLA